jgi:hypothetical protein
MMLFRTNRDFRGLRRSILLILSCAFFLTLPIYFYGIPKGNDLPQHLQFALTFYDSLQTGNLAPSLSSSTNHGFGDVGVRFYPPFSYLVLAGLKLVTGSWYAAVVIAFGMWFFLGGLGVYLCSREHFGENASTFAALAYIIAPYHVNEVYNASLFAEFAAAAILPFCFLFVLRIAKMPGPGDVAGLAVSYALLVLTHLPTALIGSAGLAVFALTSLRRPHRIKALLALSSSVGMSVLLSSYYLVRMAAELPFVNHTTAEFVERAYDFRRNFVASYFYVPAEIYNDGFQWFGDMLAVTAVCLFVPSIAFHLVYARRGSRGKTAGILGVFLVGVFFATPVSSFVWENVSLLQKIQFPYRWLVLVNLSGSLLVAAGFGYIVSAFSSRFRPFALIAAGLILVAAAFTAGQVIRPALYVSANEAEAYVSGLSNQISYKCWWPVWLRESAFAETRNITGLVSSASITYWSEYEKRFEIGPEHPPAVRLGVFYYPNWQAEVDGRAVPLSPDDDGALIVHLPEGPANVRVFFEEPFPARTAAVVSSISWLAILIILLFFLIQNLGKYVNRYSDRKPI